MAQQLRTLRRRIDSVKSTQKITGAMELIASSRIIRAQQRVEAARPYGDELRWLMASVAGAATNVDHPLLREQPEAEKLGIIVVTSDRGLAGAYNSNVLRAAESEMRAHSGGSKPFLVGKKAISYFRFRGYDYEDSWQGISDQPSIEDARAVGRAVSKSFAMGDLQQVKLAYTEFQSALTQRPAVIQLLPVPSEEGAQSDRGEGERAHRPQYVFEPEPEEILDSLLPRYVDGLIYQGLLEAAASEHAARRRAMKAATENAEELIEDLTRNFNQARQAEITTEIMEVVGGAEALAASAGTTDSKGPGRGSRARRALGSGEDLGRLS